MYTVPFAVMGCEHVDDSAKTPRLGDGQCLLSQLPRLGRVLPDALKMRRVSGQGLSLMKRRLCSHVEIKGCGEAGAIAAPAAVINAITNAIGSENLAMPATPQAVWSAIQRASATRQAAE